MTLCTTLVQSDLVFSDVLLRGGSLSALCSMIGLSCSMLVRRSDVDGIIVNKMFKISVLFYGMVYA